MNSPIIKRKLSAIMSADVKGYSRLMGEDEEATVRTITAHRGMMKALIEQNGGRVVDAPGDNLLAEFSSVVEATQCAVEIQKVLKTKNDELPENRRMEFRIGINLGDVIQEGDRIYGDGVNIAARIEGLSDAGGICISGSAYEQIENKLALGYEYLGEHAVKNITKPVKVYRIPIGPRSAKTKAGLKEKGKGIGWRAATIVAAVLVLIIGGVLVWSLYTRESQIPKTGQPEKETASKPPAPPAQPSIAVLPFVNMSGDPGQEYFSDGITENIIAGLSKLPGLLVIARNSTFTYKGKPVDVKQLGSDLGVRYVLEGSVQRSEDRVRIIAQLIDASTAQHLWAERYDRNLTDIFALQDEITLKIISALPLDLKGREKSRLAAEGTENLDAYAKVLQGMQALRGRGRPGDVQKARQIAEEAIQLDPDYPKGHTLLATTYMMEAMRKRDQTSRRSVARAFQLAQKALELDDANIEAHLLLGRIYLMRKQNEMAEAELEKAKAINPNSTEVAHALGRHYLQTGRPNEAREMFEKAVRLDPVHAQKSYVNLGRTYRMLGKHEEAVSVFKKAVQNAPDHLNIRLELIATYSALGKTEEAKAEADEVLKMNPNFTVSSFSRRSPMQNPTQREKFLDLLRQAGLPE
jgi:adenylate cyclase